MKKKIELKIIFYNILDVICVEMNGGLMKMVNFMQF